MTSARRSRALVILCLEDEPEVRDAVLRDLEPFVCPAIVTEAAETADEAREVVADVAARGDRLALALVDHLLPGENGVAFLVGLHDDPATAPAKKVLVTGQAGLDDTVEAINRADLDRYIAKPWDANEMQRIVQEQLTDFVIEHEDDVLPYLQVLDASRLLAAHRDRAADR